MIYIPNAYIYENARANGSRSNASIVPFAVDTLGNFCSVAITFLKAIAKIKFAKISNIDEHRRMISNLYLQRMDTFNLLMIIPTLQKNKITLK